VREAVLKRAVLVLRRPEVVASADEVVVDGIDVHDKGPAAAAGLHVTVCGVLWSFAMPTDEVDAGGQGRVTLEPRVATDDAADALEDLAIRGQWW
jgi:hypothetical protein